MWKSPMRPGWSQQSCGWPQSESACGTPSNSPPRAFRRILKGTPIRPRIDSIAGGNPYPGHRHATTSQRGPLRRRQAVPHHPDLRALRRHRGAHHQGVPAAGQDGRPLRYHDGLRGWRSHRRRKGPRRDGRARGEQRRQPLQHGRRPHPRLHERELEAGHRYPRAGRRRAARLHHHPEDGEGARTGGDGRLRPQHGREGRHQPRDPYPRAHRDARGAARSGRSPNFRISRCSTSG